MLLGPACSAPGPAVLHYDIDACDRCRMTISDPSFAAQLVTRTGKVYRFDDPGCLVVFVASARVPAAQIQSIWVNDHEHPDTIVLVADAVFVVSDRIRAPMNGGTAAFQSMASATALQSEVGGRIESWRQVLRRASS
jgi:copper chaperone NosL